jgi:predicted nucleic acid-binding protein
VICGTNLWVRLVDSLLHRIAHAELERGSRSATRTCSAFVASFVPAAVAIRGSSGLGDRGLALPTRWRPSARSEPTWTSDLWGFQACLPIAKAAENRVPDALLASLAIRHGATFVTADRGFRRFEGLACRYLDA